MRARMVKALQDTNYDIQGYNVFLKKICSQYTRNIHFTFFDNITAKKKLQYLQSYVIVLKHIIK